MAMSRGERRSRGIGVAMCAEVVADMAVKLWARLGPSQGTHSTSVDNNFKGVPDHITRERCPQLSTATVDSPVHNTPPTTR